MQDPVYPAFTDDGVPPVVYDWPVAIAGSPGAFPNVDYNLIKTQMAQFFPDTAPAGVAQDIIDSHTYAIGVFYKASRAASAGRNVNNAISLVLCHGVAWDKMHYAAGRQPTLQPTPSDHQNLV